MRAVIALGVLGMLALARPAAAAPSELHATPAVAVIQAAVNGTGTTPITLRNDGTTQIVAGSITADPGCDPAVHLTPLTGFTLAAGAPHALTASCTAAPAGMQRCNYRVRATTGDTLLELEAVCASAGTVGLSPDATTVDLGMVAIGATAVQTVTVTNTSAATISKLFVDTTDLAGNFAVQAPCNPDARECDAGLPAVPPGGSTSVTVACTPRAAGAASALLYLTTSAGTRLAAPIMLACTGTPVGVPVLSVSPGPVDVGAIELLGATAAAKIHLGNIGSTTTGSEVIKLLDVQIIDAGTGAALDWTYTASSPCNMHIPDACPLSPGTTVDLDLVFDPSVIGVRDATLLINYQDTADRSVSVPLHGVGRGATLDLLGFVGAQTVVDFGTLPIGGTAALGIAVVNRGTRDLLDGGFTLTPPGAPFAIAPSTGPGPGFTVTTSAPTTFSITCAPTAATTSTTDLLITAPDVASPPIHVTLRCTGADASDVLLTATPPALLLGEVRVDTQRIATVSVASMAGAIALTTAVFDPVLPSLAVTGVPAQTPATLTVTASPDTDADLSSHLVVTTAGNSTIEIPVAGNAVTASYSVPPAVSLGTFCVQQATTPRTLPFASTGSATIGVMAPSLERADSPFDLALVTPLLYPTTLAPLGSALVSVTPRRQATAGTVADDVIWKTDVDGLETSHTTLTATFLSNGSAIAPSSLEFGRTMIHLDTRNAQQVRLQNCDVSTLMLDPPQTPAPFTIDSPNFPTMLLPGETATFSVGFHPTKIGDVAKTLIITSPQTPGLPLMVALSGTGIAFGGGADGGDTPGGDSKTSFYACSGCASGGPAASLSGTLLFGLALLLVLRRRR